MGFPKNNGSVCKKYAHTDTHLLRRHTHKKQVAVQRKLQHHQSHPTRPCICRCPGSIVHALVVLTAQTVEDFFSALEKREGGGSGSGVSTPSPPHPPTQEQDETPAEFPLFSSIETLVTATPSTSHHSMTVLDDWRNTQHSQQHLQWTQWGEPQPHLHPLGRNVPRKTRPFTNPAEIPKHMDVNGVLIERGIWAKAFMQIEKGRGTGDGEEISRDVTKCAKVLFDHLFTEEQIRNSTISGRKGTTPLCPIRRKAIETTVAWMKENKKDGKDPYDFGPQDITSTLSLSKAELDNIHTKVFVERRNDRKRRKTAPGNTFIATTPTTPSTSTSTSSQDSNTRRRRAVSVTTAEIANILRVMGPEPTTTTATTPVFTPSQPEGKEEAE